jgi:hypothetical protein
MSIPEHSINAQCEEESCKIKYKWTLFDANLIIFMIFLQDRQSQATTVHLTLTYAITDHCSPPDTIACHLTVIILFFLHFIYHSRPPLITMNSLLNNDVFKIWHEWWALCGSSSMILGLCVKPHSSSLMEMHHLPCWAVSLKGMVHSNSLKNDPHRSRMCCDEGTRVPLEQCNNTIVVFVFCWVWHF